MTNILPINQGVSMPLSNEKIVLDQKKAFIREYIALLNQTNHFFEQRFLETWDRSLHSNNCKKTQLLFAFVHYISIRAMKNVILNFNRAGMVQDQQLFKLYHSQQSIEPYVQIEQPRVFSFAMAKKLLDELGHTQALTTEQYEQAAKEFSGSLKMLKLSEPYKTTHQQFQLAKADLMQSVKDNEDMTLNRFYRLRMVGILVAVAVVACIAIYASVFTLVLSGCGVFGAGFFIHTKYKNALSVSSKTFIPQAFPDDELQAMLGEDFQFPQNEFLNRVDIQVDSWVQGFLIEDSKGGDPRLLIEEGNVAKLSEDNAQPTEQADRTREVLAIMGSVINTSRPSSQFSQITSRGYRGNTHFRITGGEASQSTVHPGGPLRITNG